MFALWRRIEIVDCFAPVYYILLTVLLTRDELIVKIANRKFFRTFLQLMRAKFSFRDFGAIVLGTAFPTAKATEQSNINYPSYNYRQSDKKSGLYVSDRKVPEVSG